MVSLKSVHVLVNICESSISFAFSFYALLTTLNGEVRL